MSTKPKYTLRRNGTRRFVMRVEYHVPEDMVKFLCNTPSSSYGMGESEAVEFIRSHVEDLMDDWKQLAVDDDADAVIISTDDQDTAMQDGYIVYDGPEIVRLK